jgi:signal transduction histidine kinase
MTPVFVEGQAPGRQAPAPAPTSPRLVIDHLVRQSARTLHVSRAVVWRFEEGLSQVRAAVLYDRIRDTSEEGAAGAPGLAPAFRAALDGVKALALSDARGYSNGSEPIRAWLVQEEIAAVLAVPLRHDRRLVGLVTFEERGGAREWTAEDKEVAARLALRLAEPLTALRLTAPLVTALPAGVGAPTGATPTAPIAPTAPAPKGDALLDELARSRAPDRARYIEAPDELASPALGGRRTQVRRMGRLESAALVAAEEVVSLLEALDVQAGYFRMVEAALESRTEDRELVAGVNGAAGRVREGLVRLLGCVREGIPDRTRVDLNQLLPSMIPALAREMGEGGRLRIAPTSTSLPVEVNAALMERAIAHLVQNAREATGPEESVRLSWGPTFQSRPDGTVWEGARIRVEDRGKGIPRHDMPWIFEPFFSTRSAPHPIRGLGLPLVQGIVEGHDGWVEVQSRVGEGTEVALYLPLASQETPAPSANRPDVATPQSEPGPLTRVVLLEDEPMLSRLITQMLVRSGCRVHACSTPLEVERHLRETRGEVDVLVIESALAGGRPGQQLAEVWQTRRPDVPVVLLDRRPAAGGSGSPSTAEESGLLVIRPPFELSAVAQVLSRALAANAPAPPQGSPRTH